MRTGPPHSITNRGSLPLHFSRFRPEYPLKNLPLTPSPTLGCAKAICDAEGLHYLYSADVPCHPAESTRHPKTPRVVVEQVGFRVHVFHLDQDKCRFCHNTILGVWEGALHV